MPHKDQDPTRGMARTTEQISSDSMDADLPGAHAALTRRLQNELQLNAKIELVSGARKRSATGKVPLARYRLTYDKRSVVLQERGGGNTIQVETDRTAEGRFNSGTIDWIAALRIAEGKLRGLVGLDMQAEEIRTGITAGRGDPEIGVVIDFYVANRFPGSETAKHPVSASHARQVNRVFAIVQLLRGRRAPVSSFDHNFLDWYIGLRTTETIEFPPEYKRRKLGKLTVRKAVAEAKDFAGVIEYAKKCRILSHDPTKGYPWDLNWLKGGDAEAVVNFTEGDRRGYGILMAPSQRRDPATGHRLKAPVHRVPTADGGARLRCFHAFLFNHGRRPISISSLLCGHVAFSTEEVMALLDRAPNHRTWWAEHFPNGGVLWLSSKKQYIRFTPFGRRMGEEIRRWKAQHPCWEPDEPLFPMYSDPSRSASPDRFREWTYKAVKIARADMVELGASKPMIDRLLNHAVLYGWRSHWKSLMDSLGYGQGGEEREKYRVHNSVAFLGDWAIRGDTMEKVYSRLDPRVLQGIMDFEPADRLLARVSAEASASLEEVESGIYGEDDQTVIPIDRRRSG
jgi:hypothetical protein